MISYIHYVRSINFFQLILQCHNIHTIDFNDIYNSVETCVYIFLKRIVLFNSCLMDGMFFCATNSVYNIPYVFSLKLRYFLVTNLINLRLKTWEIVYWVCCTEKHAIHQAWIEQILGSVKLHIGDSLGKHLCMDIYVWWPFCTPKKCQEKSIKIGSHIYA